MDEAQPDTTSSEGMMTDTGAVARWYNDNAEGEHSRLQLFGLEYAISLKGILSCIETLQRDENDRKLEILDVGGGTGRYGRLHFYLLNDPRSRKEPLTPVSCRTCQTWTQCVLYRYL
jgi:hypothetical protein